MTTPQAPQDDQVKNEAQHRVRVHDGSSAKNPGTGPGERRDIEAGIDDDADRARRDPDGFERIAEAQRQQANP